VPSRLKPSLLDRLVVLVLRNPQVFENRLPNILGILAFVLAFVSVTGQGWVRVVGIAFGLLALAFYAAVTILDLDGFLARRFREGVRDDHIEVLLTSEEDQKLDEYIRTSYPSWYTPRLARTVRRTLLLLGIPRPRL